MATDLRTQLCERSKNFIAYSLAVDESRGGSREIFLGWHEGGKEIKWGGKIKAFFFQTHMQVVTYG